MTLELYEWYEVSEDILGKMYHMVDSPDNQKKVHSNFLAGNIRDEFSIDVTQMDPDITEYLNYMCSNYCRQSVKLKHMWQNRQRRYEFNPLHMHPSGDVSFVVWLRLPYDREVEMKSDNCVNSNMPSNSLFSFVYVEGGRVAETKLTPKEGLIVMFDSQTYHQVYPFFSSDGVRVSISGNMVYT